MLKSGFKTSECWIVLASKAIAVLVALGVFSAADGATVQGAVAIVVTAVVAIWGTGSVAESYLQGRKELKTQAETNRARTEARRDGEPPWTLPPN